MLSGVAGGCANGFIQLDMLRTVAQKIPDGSESRNRLSNELWLIPDWRFTCNGTITSFLLGADIMPMTTTRTLYPKGTRYGARKSHSSSVREYAIEWSEEIRLDPGYFSPSGVLEYHLNNSFDYYPGRRYFWCLPTQTLQQYSTDILQ